MPGTIYGTGKKRRDDVLNRVLDTLLKGQVIPLGGSFNPVVTQKLMSATSIASATVIDMVNTGAQVSGFHPCICGISKCGGPDVAG